jgi:hypothetical protein
LLKDGIRYLLSGTIVSTLFAKQVFFYLKGRVFTLKLHVERFIIFSKEQVFSVVTAVKVAIGKYFNLADFVGKVNTFTIRGNREQVGTIGKTRVISYVRSGVETKLITIKVYFLTVNKFRTILVSIGDSADITGESLDVILHGVVHLLFERRKQ